MQSTWTVDDENAFIEALRKTRSVTGAAESIGRSRDSCYDRRRISPDFAERWKKARRANRHDLRDNVLSRVTDGWLEDVYYQGAVVGHRRVYAGDGITAFMLRLAGFIPKSDDAADDERKNHDIITNLAEVVRREKEAERGS